MVDKSNAAPFDAKKINTEITTHLGDHQAFVAGDPLSFLISLDKNAYVVVIYEDAKQQLTQIYPYGDMAVGGALLTAGSFTVIPGNDVNFGVIDPFGEETIWMFAAESPFPKFPGSTSGAFLILDDNLDALYIRLQQHRERCNCAYGQDRVQIVTSPGENDALNILR